MNPMNRQWFYLTFRKQLNASLGAEKAKHIWDEAGKEYTEILSFDPALKKHKGAMILPAAALYRALSKENLNAENMLKEYGDSMGKLFAHAVHALTVIPGVDLAIWKNVGRIMENMSSEKLGYSRKLVSQPPEIYGVDIL